MDMLARLGPVDLERLRATVCVRDVSIIDAGLQPFESASPS